MAFTIGRVGRPGYSQIVFRAFGTDTDGTLNAWTQAIGVWTISSNVGTSPPAASSIMYAGGQPNWGDGTARLRVIFATNSQPCLVVRFADINNFVYARLTAATMDLRKVIAGADTPIASAGIAQTNGVAYWLEVVVNGTFYTVNSYADAAGGSGALHATTSGTISDPSVSSGDIGVRNGGGATAAFTFGGAFANVCTTDTLPPTLALPNPMLWADTGGLLEHGGRAATVKFMVSVTSPVGDALRLRDQLMGLDNNGDEPIVPVIVDSEPRKTGYYKVTGVMISTDPAMIVRGFAPCEVTLEPVRGFTQPMMEAIISGALLSNAVGAVAGDVVQFHGYPGAATEYYRGALGVTVNRPSADGNISFTTNGALSTAASFSLRPADFYVGAATIEQGTPLQPVVGRTTTQADPHHWRLSNGIMRVTPTVGLPNYVDIAYRKGGVWLSPTGSFALAPGVGMNDILSATILRNSTEECIIRLAMTGGSPATQGRVTIDLALRRGDRIVRMVGTSDFAGLWQIARAGSIAATAITYGAVIIGGIRATANDGDGNRFVVFSYGAATTSDLVNSQIALNVAAKQMDVGLGCEIGGSAATGTDAAVSLAGQYLAAQTESQRVVAR